MRRTMVRQRRSRFGRCWWRHRPRRLPASDRWDDMLVIRNIGNAPALFVHLEDIALQETPEDPTWRLTIAFEVEE